MAAPHRLPNPPPEDPALHVRAMDNLSFIRQTMERATAFTAVPGWGGVAMGVLALAAALVADARPSAAEWAATWLATSALALTLGGWTMAAKARRAGTTVFSYSGRRFVLSYASSNATRDGAWRKVEIRVRSSNLVVLSSGGYFAPAR